MTNVYEKLKSANADERFDYVLQRFYEISEELHDSGNMQLATRVDELIAISEVEQVDYSKLDQALNGMATLSYYSKDYSNALKLYRHAFDEASTIFGASSPQAAKALSNQANVFRDQGQFQKSAQKLENALAVFKKMLKPGHQEIIIGAVALAEDQYHAGEYASALSSFQNALKLVEASSHPVAVLMRRNCLNGLGDIYSLSENYSRGKMYYQQALDIEIERGREGGVFSADTLWRLGELFRIQSNYEAAENYLLRAFELYKKFNGDTHFSVANVLCRLAKLYHDKIRNQKQCDTSKQISAIVGLYNKSLLILERERGENHPDVAECLLGLANVLVEIADYQSAENYVLRAKKIIDQSLGEYHLLYATCVETGAVIKKEKGDYDAAEVEFEHSRDLKERFLGNEHREVASILEKQANLYVATGRNVLALELLEECRHIRDLKVLNFCDAE